MRSHTQLHHLHHYPELIEEYGPLVYYSTFRYERKHQQFKNLAERLRNQINLPKTLAERSQRSATTIRLIPSESQDLFEGEKLVKQHEVGVIQLRYDCDTSGYVKYRRAIINHIAFENGLVYRLARPDKFWNKSLAKVDYILRSQDKNILIFCELLSKVNYNKLLCAYEVEESSRFIVLKPTDFLLHKPIDLFKDKAKLYVQKSFSV